MGAQGEVLEQFVGSKEATTKVVYKKWRRTIPTTVKLNAADRAQVSMMMKITRAEVDLLETQFLTECPGYGKAPDEPRYLPYRLPAKKGVKVYRNEMANATIKVDTPLAKAFQQTVTSAVGLAQAAVKMTNKSRPRDCRVTDQDFQNFAVVNTMESLEGLKKVSKRKGPAFNGTMRVRKRVRNTRAQDQGSNGPQVGLGLQGGPGNNGPQVGLGQNGQDNQAAGNP